MVVKGIDRSADSRAAYVAPSIERLGLFHVETRNFCVLGKQFGGHDTWAGIVGIAISNCSG